MITTQDILNYLHAQPFRPFRVQVADGQTFDVRHPEMARVGRDSMVLFTFVSDEPEIVDRWETVSLMMIERISHLDPAIPQG
jgi:hypothetical protein